MFPARPLKAIKNHLLPGISLRSQVFAPKFFAPKCCIWATGFCPAAGILQSEIESFGVRALIEKTL
jgi:hypothetical protein